MGLKGAASYFQQMMWSIVLVNLIARICESYLDDIIITGSTEDEFMTNLELVFERFVNFNITLKASKCRFGLSQVEYVGRLIDATGTHFTESKLDSILNIAKPITQKHLKSFLGLANWFREHVQNYSIIAIPLQKLILGYTPRNQLVWTPEATEAFENLRLLIHKCPKLFFLDDVSPIYLYVDASILGVGA
jgi:hypothetical protein